MSLFKIKRKPEKIEISILGIKLKFKKNPIPKSYGKREIIANEKGNDEVIKLLNSDKPCLISRLGMSELNIIDYYLQHKDEDNINFPEDKVAIMKNNAGFFPATNENLVRYSKAILELLPNVDLICPWMWTFPAERFVIENYATNAIITTSHCISQSLFFYDNPWIQCLEGKKVLVIHPFEQTIKSQHQKLKLLFNNPKFSPEYELLTIKAVQGIGGSYKNLEYKDWFEALEHMYSEIDKRDFDVAIIGAGAYGMLLANYIKNKGKKALHICGATQLLFGIKGGRWDAIPKFSKEIYNESWVRPLECDTVQNLDDFVKGEGTKAYW